MNNELNIQQLDLFDFFENANTLSRKAVTPETNSDGKLVLKLSNFKSRETTSLFRGFKQVAHAIYETYDWTDEQILEAAEQIYPFIGFKTNAQTYGNKVKEAIFVSDKDQKKLSLYGRSNQTYCIPIYFRMYNSEYYRRFLILSDSESLVSHYTDTYYRKDKPFVRYAYLSKADLLGYVYLMNDIINHIKNTDPAKLGFSHNELHDLFKGLIAGNRASNYMFYDYCLQRTTDIKQWQSDVMSDLSMLQDALGFHGKDRHLWDGYNDFKRMIDFVQDYLNKHYLIQAA